MTRRVDAACRHWIKHDTWPAGMTTRTRWFVCLRVAHAAELAVTLLPPHRGEPAVVQAAAMDNAAMCEWFLIDVWTCGRPVWNQRLVDAVLPHETKLIPGLN